MEYDPIPPLRYSKTTGTTDLKNLKPGIINSLHIGCYLPDELCDTCRTSLQASH